MNLHPVFDGIFKPVPNPKLTQCIEEATMLSLYSDVIIIETMTDEGLIYDFCITEGEHKVYDYIRRYKDRDSRIIKIIKKGTI